MFEGVIFDLDGTLLNTLPDIAGSMNRVLLRFGLPAHPVDAYRLMVGNGARVLTERAVGERREKADEVYHAYRAEYAAHTCDLSRPYPGIMELVEQLKGRDVRMAVFSNKDDTDVRTVIGHYFPASPFSVLRGRRADTALKPAPDGALKIAEELRLRPDQLLYVGDTGTDMDCGKNARMTTVGVTWGFRTREELKTHQACHIVDRPEEILTLIDQSTETKV